MVWTSPSKCHNHLHRCIYSFTHQISIPLLWQITSPLLGITFTKVIYHMLLYNSFSWIHQRTISLQIAKYFLEHGVGFGMQSHWSLITFKPCVSMPICSILDLFSNARIISNSWMSDCHHPWWIISWLQFVIAKVPSSWEIMSLWGCHHFFKTDAYYP